EVVEFLLGIGDGGTEGALEVLGGRGDFVLQVAQFVEFDLALDVGLHVVDVALQLPEPFAACARHPRQSLGPDDDQSGDRRDHQFGEGDVEHATVRMAESEAVSGDDHKGSPGCPDFRARDCTGRASAGEALAPRRGCQTFSLASTSMVLAVLFDVDDSAPACSAPSLTPSLKPRTAPPRSEPMFFSFLVPKTNMMMTSTINQCQMLIAPI